MATTAFCNSAKVELLQGGHCLFATQTGLTGAGVNGAFTLTGLSSTAAVAVGMAASGTNIASGAIVASIDSASQVTVSKAHTGTVTNGISFTGDVLKMLLIKVAPSTTFAGTQTNVGTPGTGASSVTNVGTDETSGTGYTSGGTTLTNVTPTLSSTTAITNFSPNPNWTTASFSATAAIILIQLYVLAMLTALHQTLQVQLLTAQSQYMTLVAHRRLLQVPLQLLCQLLTLQTLSYVLRNNTLLKYSMNKKVHGVFLFCWTS
jgi:hypothetical protein